MKDFYEHHKNSIEFGDRCFDRLLLNGLIQPFQQPERVLGFFNSYRDGKRVTRRTLTEIADQFHYWVNHRSEKWGVPIVEAPQQERRADFLLHYFQKTPAAHLAVLLQPREASPVGREELLGRFHPLLPLPGGTQSRLPPPPLLFPGRTLRQPDFLPPRRRRSVRRALAGHEPNHRTAQKDYSHLWPQSDQAIQGQAANRARRPRSSQSRHSQSLRPRIRQAIRPRPPFAANRTCHQRCDRLRGQQEGREPTSPAPTHVRNH